MQRWRGQSAAGPSTFVGLAGAGNGRDDLRHPNPTRFHLWHVQRHDKHHSDSVLERFPCVVTRTYYPSCSLYGRIVPADQQGRPRTGPDRAAVDRAIEP